MLPLRLCGEFSTFYETINHYITFSGFGLGVESEIKRDSRPRVAAIARDIFLKGNK